VDCLLVYPRFEVGQPIKAPGPICFDIAEARAAARARRHGFSGFFGALMSQFMLQGASGSRSKPAEMLGIACDKRDTKKAAGAA
jgi:hypothetical protein